MLMLILVSEIRGLVGMTKECKRNVRAKINSLVRQKLIWAFMKLFPYQIVLDTTGIRKN